MNISNCKFGVSIISTTIPTTPFFLSWVDQALSKLPLSSPQFGSTCKLECRYVWSNENYEYPKYIFLNKGKGSKIIWWMYKRQGKTWPTKKWTQTLNMIRILTTGLTSITVMLIINLLACVSSPAIISNSISLSFLRSLKKRRKWFLVLSKISRYFQRLLWCFQKLLGAFKNFLVLSKTSKYF